MENSSWKMKAAQTETIIGYFSMGILVLLVLLLPFVDVPAFMHANRAGKFVVFACGVLLVFGLFLVGRLLVPAPVVIRINRMDMLLLVLLFYAIARRHLLPPVSDYSRNEMELIGLSVLYVVMRWTDGRVFSYFYLAVIASGMLASVYGLLQLWGYCPSHNANFRMTAGLFNPGPYAGFLAGTFPVALGTYFFRSSFCAARRRWMFEYLSLAGLAVMLLVVPATQSRAAWLGIAVASLYLVAQKHGLRSVVLKHFNRPYKRGLATMSALLLAMGVFVGLFHFKKTSADGRMLIWKVSVGMAMEKPLFGIGYDNFQAHYMDRQADYFREHPDSTDGTVADNVDYAFNEPLQFLVENGLVGFAMLILLVVWVLSGKYVGKTDPLLTIAQAGLLSLLVFSLFSYPREILPIKLCAVLYLTTISRFCSAGFRRIVLLGTKTLRLLWKGSVLIVLFVAIPAAGIHINELRRGYEDWRVAHRLYESDFFDRSAEKYREIRLIFGKDGGFLAHYGKALSMAGKHEEAVSVLEEARRYRSTTIVQTALGDSYKALGDYQKAEEAYWRASFMAPNRFYPKYLLVKLYAASGNREAALRLAEELLAKEIKVGSAAIEEMKAEILSLIDSGQLRMDNERRREAER